MSFSKYLYGIVALQLLSFAPVSVMAAPPNAISERAPAPTPAPTPAPGLEKRYPGVAADQSPNLQKRGFWINHLPFLWDCSIYTGLTTTDFYGEMSTQNLPPGSTSCRCAGDTRVAIDTATNGPCTTIKCHGGQRPMISFVGPETCTPQPKGSIQKLYWNILGVQYKPASNTSATPLPSKRAALPQETGFPNSNNDNDDIGAGVLNDPSNAQDDSDIGSGVLTDTPDATGTDAIDPHMTGSSSDDSFFQSANSAFNSVFGSSSATTGKAPPSGVRHDATGTSGSVSSTSYSTSSTLGSSSSSSSSGTSSPPPTTGNLPAAATSQGSGSQPTSSALAPGVQDMKAQGVVVGILAGVVAMFMM